MPKQWSFFQGKVVVEYNFSPGSPFLDESCGCCRKSGPWGVLPIGGQIVLLKQAMLYGFFLIVLRKCLPFFSPEKAMPSFLCAQYH